MSAMMGVKDQRPTGPRVARYQGNSFQVVGLPELSPIFRTRAVAEQWLAANKPASVKTRDCLCCGSQFESEGAHNRLCDTCRNRRDYLPDAGYGGARGNGRALQLGGA